MGPGGLCNRLIMNGKPQRSQYLQVVNLSEGCIPPLGRGSRRGLCNRLIMNGRPQGTEPLQVVNLSEGCILSSNTLSLCKLLIYPRDGACPGDGDGVGGAV